MFYKEVLKTQEIGSSSALALKEMQRAACGKCGELFSNKKGVKQHILRMHVNKTMKVALSVNEKDHVNDEKILALEKNSEPVLGFVQTPMPKSIEASLKAKIYRSKPKRSKISICKIKQI